MAFTQRYRYSYSGADTKCWAYFPNLVRASNTTVTIDSETQTGTVGFEDLWGKNRIDPEYEHGIGAGTADSFSYVMSDPEIESLYRPKIGPVELEALHTISISISEPRGPARALGFRNIKGFARSVRTIAGSIIMTVIEDHPLRKLMEQEAVYGPEWSMDVHRKGIGSLFDGNNQLIKLPTMMSPFNIMSVYMSETTNLVPHQIQGSTAPALSNYAGFLLEDVEFIGEGMTTSVNDMVTEVMYQFVAQNYREFSANVTSLGDIDPIKLDQMLMVDSDAESSMAAMLQESLYNEEMGLG